MVGRIRPPCTLPPPPRFTSDNQELNTKRTYQTLQSIEMQKSNNPLKSMMGNQDKRVQNSKKKNYMKFTLFFCLIRS